MGYSFCCCCIQPCESLNVNVKRLSIYILKEKCIHIKYKTYMRLKMNLFIFVFEIMTL